MLGSGLLTRVNMGWTARISVAVCDSKGTEIPGLREKYNVACLRRVSRARCLRKFTRNPERSARRFLSRGAIRLKHPDKGEDVDGILERGDLEIPPLRLMRQAANTVLKQTMVDALGP